MTAAMELLQLEVPQAALRVSPENTASPTAPNANYAPPESSATKPMPPPAKLAYLAQEAPTVAQKELNPTPIATYVQRAKPGKLQA